MTEEKVPLLIVASKVKAYVKDKGLRTSEGFLHMLSERLTITIDQCIEDALADGRKTVMDKDV